jgi:hypothetical protein
LIYSGQARTDTTATTFSEKDWRANSRLCNLKSKWAHLALDKIHLNPKPEFSNLFLDVSTYLEEGFERKTLRIESWSYRMVCIITLLIGDSKEDFRKLVRICDHDIMAR